MKQSKLNIRTKSWLIGGILGFATVAIVVQASVTTIFASGDTLSSTAVNQNFADLDTRLAALEAKGTTSRNGRMAYQWVSDTASGPVANSTYTYNPTGGTNAVVKNSAGDYTVTFPGLGAANGGFAMVSKYSNGDINCHVRSWSNSVNSGADVTVDVLCYDSAGNLVNSAFTALFID